MRLSVVVAIVDGGHALERCLHALAAQQHSASLEVIVPWDDSVSGLATLAAEFPSFRFLPLGGVTTARPRESLSGQHELFDRRRSAGLAAATGDVVALLEDRGVPASTWAATLLAHHAARPNGVIGGAIENGRDGALHSAVYLCDFARYQRPFEAGPSAWISDVNVGYKRAALQDIRNVWIERYHEPVVHAALVNAGETLYLTPDVIVVEHRDGLRLGALLAERFAWGRLFAHQRVQDSSWAIRMGLALASPMLPFLLSGRIIRQAIRQRHLGQFLRSAPLILLLLTAWSLGELVGYVTADS